MTFGQTIGGSTKRQEKGRDKSPDAAIRGVQLLLAGMSIRFC